MIISRVPGLVRNATLLRKSWQQFQQNNRNSSHHWNYRSAIQHHPKIITYASEGILGFMWWWILWHLWTEPGHVTGEFDYPVPANWTDSELGIADE